MKDFPELVAAIADRGKLLFGEGPNADKMSWFESGDDFCEMSATGFLDGCHTLACKFVRREVCPSVLHPNERAEIGHEVIFEKGISRSVDFFEESPESATRDL